MKRIRKIRKQIYLDPEHDAKLKQQAAQLRVSEAEIIRQSLQRNRAEDVIVPLRRPDLWAEEMKYLRDLLRKHRTTKKIPRGWTRESLYEERLENLR